MTKNKMNPLLTQPESLKIGKVFVGAKLCGSFQIQTAGLCHCYYNFNTRQPVPDWIDLQGPTTTDEGLFWSFAIRTYNPGHLFASLRFECDTGVAHWPISLDICEGDPVLGDIAICSSPFDHQSGYVLLKSLVRILNVLPLRIHCLDSLTEIGQLRPRTVVLHQTGLLKCNSDDVDLLRGLVDAGGNVLVLADEFYRGTTTAANRILVPFGLKMKQDGADEPGLSDEQRLQRRLNWQDRYERVDFVSGPSDVSGHPLTHGVKRVLWSRPCPVLCTGGSSIPLVKNPLDNDEYFAAVSKSMGYIVAIGNSLWSCLSSVGWPYDNDRLLANVLVGDNAESHLHWICRR